MSAALPGEHDRLDAEVRARVREVDEAGRVVANRVRAARRGVEPFDHVVDRPEPELGNAVDGGSGPRADWLGDEVLHVLPAADVMELRDIDVAAVARDELVERDIGPAGHE